MNIVHDQTMQSKSYRLPEDTLKVWKYLEYMYNMELTDKYMKKFDNQIGMYFNEDGSWKEPVCISRIDRYNIENGIITKKKIRQLEALLNKGAKPRRLKDRQDLYTLIIDGQIYDFLDYQYLLEKISEELDLMHYDYLCRSISFDSSRRNDLEIMF